MQLKTASNYLRSRWWMLILFVLTFISRLLFLSNNPLGLDEPFSVYFSQMSFAEMASKLNTENNPPFFYFLLHLWMKVFGISEFSVRFLPALFSALVVPLAYKLGQTFFTWRVGFTSALLFLLSESQMEFAHDCRTYSLLMLLALALFYLSLHMQQFRIRNKHWIAFISLNATLLYTHFIGWIVVFLLLCMNLVFAKPATRKKYFLSYFFVLILVMPYLQVFKERLFSSVTHPGWQSQPHVTDLYNRFVSFFNKPLVAVCSLLIIASGLLIQLKSFKQLPAQEKSVILGFALGYFGLFAISFRFPLFMERYLLVFSIPLYFLLAIAIERICTWKNQAVLLFFVCIALMCFTTNLNPIRNKPSNKIVGLLNRLKQNKQTALVISPEWYEPSFLYYYDIEIFKHYHQSKPTLAAKGIFCINSLDSKWVNEQLSNYKKIIYFQSNPDLVDVTNQNIHRLEITGQRINTFEAYNCKFSVFNQLAKEGEKIN